MCRLSRNYPFSRFGVFAFFGLIVVDEVTRNKRMGLDHRGKAAKFTISDHAGLKTVGRHSHAGFTRLASFFHVGRSYLRIPTIMNAGRSQATRAVPKILAPGPAAYRVQVFENSKWLGLHNGSCTTGLETCTATIPPTGNARSYRLIRLFIGNGATTAEPRNTDIMRLAMRCRTRSTEGYLWPTGFPTR